MTNAEKHYAKMTETPVAKLILNLGIPTTISMLITNIYNMADTYFVGTLGESAQAATGVLFTVQAIMQGIAFMFGHGGGTFISRALADKNTKEATKYISSAFFMGGLIGVMITILGLTFLDPLVRFLGSTETIVPHAKDYGTWILLAAPFIICSFILNNGLRYEGKAFYAMYGLTAGGLLNILGDYILVMKCGLGVYGAGLATAASQVVSFAILLYMYLKTAFTSIATDALSGVKNETNYTNFKSAGSYLVSGFCSGISANTYKAKAKASAMAAAAAAAAKKKLDIHSPSRVFYKIGDNTGRGFVNALDHYASIAYKSGSDMADSARIGLSNAISRITNIINNDIDAQPTIRPVLDLSAVESGAGAINGMFGQGLTLGASADIDTISSMMNSSIQNGGNAEVVSAINKLRKDLSNVGNTSYNISGITYDDGSNISEAVQSLVRAAKMERRI